MNPDSISIFLSTTALSQVASLLAAAAAAATTGAAAIVSAAVVVSAAIVSAAPPLQSCSNVSTSTTAVRPVCVY